MPSELVTASGSGSDPDISPQTAYSQVKRIATVRNLSEAGVSNLIAHHTKKPLVGLFGTSKINALKLNITLGNSKK
jgi:potassium-transporting ATPase KdpC subunit